MILFLFRLGIEQYRRLEEAEGRKQRKNNFVNDHSGALVTHSRLLAPKSESLQLNRRASILREATSIILNELIILFRNLEKCTSL